VRPPNREVRMLIRLLFIIGLLVLAVRVLNAQLRPLISSMALAEVKNQVTKVIDNAINREIATDQLQYSDLIVLDKDTEGKVTALRTNMARINQLQAQLTTAVLHEIEEMDNDDLGIPVGSLTGVELFSGRGPRIYVRILSVGSVKSAFSNTFTSTGINQTRHRIFMTMTAEVKVLLPGYTVSTTIEAPVNVAETVIVGSVPDNYTYFSQFDTPEDAAGYYFDFGAGINSAE
jgi:sporulation protein YunB